MAETDLQPESARPETRRPTLWTRAGVGLLGISVLLWVPLPVLPFLSMSGAQKAGLGGGFVVAAEIAFWVGAALAGPEAAKRTRSWIGRFFRKREREERRAP